MSTQAGQAVSWVTGDELTYGTCPIVCYLKAFQTVPIDHDIRRRHAIMARDLLEKGKKKWYYRFLCRGRSGKMVQKKKNMGTEESKNETEKASLRHWRKFPNEVLLPKADKSLTIRGTSGHVGRKKGKLGHSATGCSGRVCDCNPM